MKILVIGGNGFIGRHVVQACFAAKHRVVKVVRHPREGEMGCDLSQLSDLAAWSERLDGIDAVINCAGVLAGGYAELRAVHCDSPAVVAAGCKRKGIPFVHVSVLGLADAPGTPYFRSKREGEVAVRAANPAAVIVRPSMVYGADSPATKLMLLQSRLPLFVLPARTQPVAPVHVDDLAQLCVQLASTVRAHGCSVDCVGPAEMSIAGFLQALRAGRHAGRAHVVHVPNGLMRAALRMMAFLGARMATPQVLDLMEHPHTGSRESFLKWMHRAPRGVETFHTA